MKNSNDTIGNQTRDLPACSAVPQPRAPTTWEWKIFLQLTIRKFWSRGEVKGRWTERQWIITRQIGSRSHSQPVRLSARPLLGHAMRLLASSCLPVCVARNNSAPTGRISTKFDIWGLFEKPIWKIRVSLKSDKNNGHFKWTPMYTYYTTWVDSS